MVCAGLPSRHFFLFHLDDEVCHNIIIPCQADSNNNIIGILSLYLKGEILLHVCDMLSVTHAEALIEEDVAVVPCIAYALGLRIII